MSKGVNWSQALRAAVRTRIGRLQLRVGDPGPTATVVDLSTNETVGTVSRWGVEASDAEFRRVVDEEVLSAGGAYVALVPGEEAGAYHEVWLAPGDAGFARGVCNDLPMPYDLGDRRQLGEFEPPRRGRR